jgi:hypothetical protein
MRAEVPEAKAGVKDGVRDGVTQERPEPARIPEPARTAEPARIPEVVG